MGKLMLIAGVCAVAAATVARAADWQPTQDDNMAVYGLTEQYLAAEDKGDFASASHYLSDGMRKKLAASTWQATFADRTAKFGNLRSRQIVNIDWEQNPSWAPPGVYATAGYSAVFTKASLYCGLVSWQLGADKHFKVVREEFSGVGNDALAKMDPASVVAFKVKYHCDGPPPGQ